MVDFAVNDVASLGLVKDVPEWQLPPEGWSQAVNIRFTDDGVTKGASWAQILNTSPDTPYYIQSVRTSSLVDWLIYCDLNAVFAWDGVSTADISGVSSPYGTVNTWDWNGTTLGGTPILTNDLKPPQYWPSISLGANLADLPAWVADVGANSHCKSIRAFGPYLVALNVTIAGVKHPHGVLWSHPADPGFMPASWAYTDPTKDAGFNELTDSDAGVIVDGLPLKDKFIIYKENATWTMKLIGGQYIMQFDPLFISSGILAPHCAAMTGDGKYHFVATADDLIIHDGVTTKSIIDKRMRKSVFGRIDINNHNVAFVFSVPTQREMWFAFPESGAPAPTRALVWKYGENAGDGVLSESQFAMSSAAVNDVLQGNGESWSSDTDTWSTTTDRWDSASQRRTVISDASLKKILLLDAGILRDSVPYTGTLTREALAIEGKRRGGQPVTNYAGRKYVKRIWPRVGGGTVTVRLGMVDYPGGNTQWAQTKSFNPLTQKYLDFMVNGLAAPSVEFSWTANDNGVVYGYMIEVFSVGRF